MKKHKLLDQVKNVIRIKHYSIRTEQAYVGWIKDYILYNNKKHPKDLTEKHISEYLTHLAVKRNVAASTQNQAMSAILFLYKEVLDINILKLPKTVFAQKPTKLPTVFSIDEVKDIFTMIDDKYKLMASLLYGSGLRLMECIRLRVKDVDFNYKQLTVRCGKGNTDRLAKNISNY